MTLENEIAEWLTPTPEPVKKNAVERITKDDGAGSQHDRYIWQAQDANTKAQNLITAASASDDAGDYKHAGDLSITAQAQFLEEKSWLESAAGSGNSPDGSDLLAQAVTAMANATSAQQQADVYYKKLLDVPLYDENSPVVQLDANGNVIGKSADEILGEIELWKERVANGEIEVEKGDAPGHEFHGNQYQQGLGGGPPHTNEGDIPKDMKSGVNQWQHGDVGRQADAGRWSDNTVTHAGELSRRALVGSRNEGTALRDPATEAFHDNMASGHMSIADQHLAQATRESRAGNIDAAAAHADAARAHFSAAGSHYFAGKMAQHGGKELALGADDGATDATRAAADATAEASMETNNARL